MAKKSELQRAIDALDVKILPLMDARNVLMKLRDEKATDRKPRTPKAKTAAGGPTGHGGTT